MTDEARKLTGAEVKAIAHSLQAMSDVIAKNPLLRAAVVHDDYHRHLANALITLNEHARRS